MKVRGIALLLAAASAAWAGDWEFDHVVRAIEQHYGIKRTYIPFMGFANFVVKVARPAGTSGFKLAVFEDIGSAIDFRDQDELNQLMNRFSSRDLHPLVRVRSRGKGESTYIYAGEIGKSTRMLIANFGRNEATVIEVKANIDTLLRTLDQPGNARRTFYPTTSSNR